MSDSYLFAFHLGPVQEFIAIARRTQDWWMGSWLLSHLSRKAMETARARDAILVLPQEMASGNDPTVANTPNHFIARLRSQRPADVTHAVDTAVRAEWLRITQAVKIAFFDATLDPLLWARQVGNFLEIYWVIVPDDGNKEARNQAQAALDARKRLRDFTATQEPDLKCTLCGVRQELSQKTSVREARAWWEGLVKSYHGRLRVRENGNERLCAVCAVKRAALPGKALQSELAKDDGSFPSTSSMAAALFKKCLLETGRGGNEVAAHLHRLEKQLFVRPQVDKEALPGLSRITSALPHEVRNKLLTFDGGLFYVEAFTLPRITEEFPGALEAILKRGAKEYGVSVEKMQGQDPPYVTQEIAEVANGLRTLYGAVRDMDPEQNIPPPSKYYAALMMDGDRMGAFFGKVSDEQAQDLSRRLSQFAREQVKAIVEAHLGRLVYAGGDDALALVPLKTALSCARELQKQFKEAVSKVASGFDLPTPSIGIAMAHHTAPLDAVLLAMQRAEKSAKNDYRRDALCVHVLKRSGEEVRVGSHWNYGDLDVVGLMERLVAAFDSPVLSMRFAQAVAAEVRGLSGKELPADARAAALRRLARRHAVEGSEEPAEALATALAAWAEGEISPSDARPLGIREVAAWVGLARFIVSGGRDEG